MPPWSVDPTIRFNRIHVIESLPPPEQTFSNRTGAQLFEDLQDLCVGTPVLAQLHVVSTRRQLFALLDQIEREVPHGNFPILHFETHGAQRPPGRTTTSPGIVLGSLEGVSWRELAPYFTAINEATRLNLVLFISACYGLDIAALVQPLKPAPARILIGPMRPIEISEIHRATSAFYSTLFKANDGAAAVQAMKRTFPQGRDPILPLTAEWMFLNILLGYFNSETSQSAAAARAERIVMRMILDGIPPKVATAQRKGLIQRLQDHQEVFDATYRRFFFVDKHPEIADRFRMTYESCFQEAATEAV